MPAMTMRGPRGPRMALGHGWNAMNVESWIVSAFVEYMLASGLDARHLDVEVRITPGDVPDLLYLDASQAYVYEAKRHRPTPADLRQVRRYMAAAASKWPEHDVAGFLLWSTERPTDWRELTIERVTT